VRVDPGETEVRDPAHRPGSEAIDRGRDVEIARCHRPQQRLDLGTVHARKASAGSVPTVPADLQLDRDVLEWLALGGAIAAGLALLLVLFSLARVRALNKRVRRIAGAPREAVAGIDPAALRHVAVVRYDAFGDMGGKLSFSAAMYDDNGDGLVLSAINGRSETRSYAKPLSGFTSDQRLSPEEEDAIARARRD
jgi:hypothetical protein